MRLLLTLAWRNLWIHKLRTVLTIISITLGVAVILAVRTANRSTFKKPGVGARPASFQTETRLSVLDDTARGD